MVRRCLAARAAVIAFAVVSPASGVRQFSTEVTKDTVAKDSLHESFSRAVQAPTTMDKLRATWSWNTLPVFFHSMNMSGDWSPEAAAQAARYRIVTLEKAHGAPKQNGARNRYETTGLRGCLSIKAKDPSAVVFYYLNSLIDYNFPILHDRLENNATWRLKNSQGLDALPLANHWGFNLSVPEMRRAWMDSCLNATAAGCDGCFIDKSKKITSYGARWASDHDETIRVLNMELQARGKMAINNNAGDLARGITAMLIEDFAASEKCILRLREAVLRGLVVVAHAGSFVDDGSSGTVNSCVNGDINAMAAFLIGAGNHSYYHCSSDDAYQWKSNPSWPTATDQWLDWLPEYDLPLGVPRGDAVKDTDGVWFRQFDHAAGTTSVTFASTGDSAGRGTITWADGTVQAGLPSPQTLVATSCGKQTM